MLTLTHRTRRRVSKGTIRRARAKQSASNGNGSPAATAPDPVESAKDAGLHYVHDDRPGIRRVRSGGGFRYVNDVTGKTVRDEETLLRIKSLVVPPAWESVWICPDPRGHIQAVGRDQRGRKQYRYHPRWREVRDETKYGRMIAFGKALPRIRRRVARDLRQKGLPREKVLAAVVRLLETTLIRVGNDEYAKENHHFGLTTMRDKHADIRGDKIHFDFRGKSGVQHTVDLHDKRLARIVKQCQDIPGYDLFQYIDGDGQHRAIGSAEVNEYLKEISGQDFTAKDFRTWAGTVLAAMALQELKQFDSQAQAKRNLVAAIEAVAGKLGNTKTVCRKCYIHPAVIDSYMDGTLAEVLAKKADEKIAKSLHNLRPEEAAVMTLLHYRLKQEAAAHSLSR